MANPRQRRKSRSSSHRPVSHSRRQKTLQKKMPPIRGPKILQDAWDNKKTVRQNYAALGLVHSLNPLLSGGVEKEPQAAPEATEDARQTVDPSSSAIPKGYGKIIRNEDGEVIRVELAEEEEQDDNREKDMEELENELVVDKEVMASWVDGIGGGKNGEAKIVAKQLECISLNKTSSTTTLSLPMSSNVVPRHISRLEQTYLQRLVDKHGTDVEAMAKDRRVNPEQRTSGELKRGLRRLGFNTH